MTRFLGYIALLADRLHCAVRGHEVRGVHCRWCDLYEYAPQHRSGVISHYHPRCMRPYRYIR